MRMSPFPLELFDKLVYSARDYAGTIINRTTLNDFLTQFVYLHLTSSNKYILQFCLETYSSLTDKAKKLSCELNQAFLMRENNIREKDRPIHVTIPLKTHIDKTYSETLSCD